MKTKLLLLFGIGTIFIVGLLQAADPAPSKPAASLEPVEDDVHEFMEYAFEPFFKQLKEAVKDEPANRKAWVPIKATSLILAENGNLLMLRGPEENKSEWDALSKQLRDEGKQLYQSAKKRDYDLTKKHYATFVTKCNACHEKFADGKHIQKP